MLVHFINGPYHGRTEALREGASDRIKVIIADTMRSYWNDDGFSPCLNWTEGEYKVTRRSRYAIAEYVEPKVNIHVAVEVTFDPHMLSAGRLYLLFSGTGPVGDGITQTPADNTGRPGTIEVSFDVLVEGPPDGLAVADATTKVNAYVQRKMNGVSSAAIKSVAASS